MYFFTLKLVVLSVNLTMVFADLICFGITPNNSQSLPAMNIIDNMFKL